MVERFLISIILIGIVILLMVGKGDWLIAGYNTASAEKKRSYNIKRLRIALATTMLLVALAINIPVLGVCGIRDKEVAIAIVLVCFVYMIVGNTWCKFKK